jgi:hypothetical protein
VADNYQIEMLNITSPSNIIECAQFDVTIGAHDLLSDGEYVYVAAANPGFFILQFGGNGESHIGDNSFVLMLVGLSIGVVALVILVVVFLKRRQTR